MGDNIVRREPIGVCGLITAWNWPVQLICHQALVGLRGRLHRGREAERVHADQRARAGRGPARGGRSAGRVQPRHRRRADRGQRHQRASRHRHGVLHRLDPRRRPGRRGRRSDGQAGLPGTRRQVRQHHPARRRPRGRGALERRARLLQHAASPATRRPASWCTSGDATSVLRPAAARRRRSASAIPRIPRPQWGRS